MKSYYELSSGIKIGDIVWHWTRTSPYFELFRQIQ